MSLKKKSKSLGHLSSFDSHPEYISTPASKKSNTPKKFKGLVRQKTNPLLTNPMSGSKGFLTKTGSKPELLSQLPHKNRSFLIDTQVKYSIGLSSIDRNLFLFNDLLLIAKERSGSHFKLKDQVLLSDLWISNSIDEVSEAHHDPSTSFVIGWPITNAVITFNSPNLKILWWDMLTDLMDKEKKQSPSSTNIQVIYFDTSTNFEHVKNLQVGIKDNATDCIQKSLSTTELLKYSEGDYMLCVRTKSDEIPVRLIGHEIPLIIKLYWSRQVFTSRNQKSYDEYKNGYRCSFILRRVETNSNILSDDVTPKNNKLKKVKSSIKLQRVFRRSSKTTEGHETISRKGGKLFGLRLEDTCLNNLFPSPIHFMLVRLYSEGPSTIGIFRRSPNARAMRELREKLDEELSIDFSECSVFVVAALLKDFFRSLPDSLLMCNKYESWIRIGLEFEQNRDIHPVRSFVYSLPAINLIFLKHILYILSQISSRSQDNMMTASNLGICVGPSILWSSDSKIMLEPHYSKDVSLILKILIEEYSSLFGDEVPHLFTSEIIKGSNVFYEHSSLDSLLDGLRVPSQGISLTNLSQDSGLTTSDSTLYNITGENNSFSSDEFCVIDSKQLTYSSNYTESSELRRTASEESVVEISSRTRKPHRKGKAPLPPILRSNSVNEALWIPSSSNNSNSSTPIVSRSNSHSRNDETPLPPGYEETISRQKLFKTYTVFEETTLSRPPPLPPKRERPPLPPKQKIRHEETFYANTEDLRRKQNTSRDPFLSKSTRSIETQTDESDFIFLEQSDSSESYSSTPPPELYSDPLFHGEINWSVSQLRSLFNESQQLCHSNNNSNSSNNYHHHTNGILSRKLLFDDESCEPDSDQESYV